MQDAAPDPEIWTDDVATPGLVRRIAALLERDGRALASRSVLPRGWHVGLFTSDVSQSRLRPDGYAGPGIPLPDLGLPRVMLGGRRASFAGDIPLEAEVRRRSTLEEVSEKAGRSGRLALVTVRNEVFLGQDLIVTELEDYVLRDAETTARSPAAKSPAAPNPYDVALTITPDEPLLFRFCALTYNAHRIHYDAPYARGVEGYPALVVNGALTALLALELVRTEAGREPASFAYRALRPLFCGRPIRLKVRAGDKEWRAWAEDEAGQVALEATFR